MGSKPLFIDKLYSPIIIETEIIKNPIILFLGKIIVISIYVLLD